MSFASLEPLKNIKFEGEKTRFPAGPVIRCFVIPPNSKIEKMRRNRLFNVRWLTNCRGFKEHDLIKCELKVQVVISLGS